MFNLRFVKKSFFGERFL